MSQVTRRQFMATAAALGAVPVWAATHTTRSQVAANSSERRDLFPEGVASGDPQPDSVLLWTRRPFDGGRGKLLVEVAEDDAFKHVIASANATVSAAADWTCRVLVGNLKLASVYWYRFTDETGFTSRV